MSFDYLKPNKENRIDFTFKKVQKLAFIEKLRLLGIPILKYISRDKSIVPDVEEYSFEHLLDYLVTTVIDQGKKIKELENAVG